MARVLGPMAARRSSSALPLEQKSGRNDYISSVREQSEEFLMSFLSIFGTIRLAPFGRSLAKRGKSISQRRI